MARLGKCCCNCNNGTIIDRWLNQTKVRPVNDGTPADYSATPYARYSGLNEDECIPNTTGPGHCGTWLVGGDFNGVSAQEVEDTVNDIMTCAADDATHKKDDHNCYEKSGTVNMLKRRVGGQWVTARKYWQGDLGFTDTDNGCPDPYDAPAQTKYTSINYSMEYSLLPVDGTPYNQTYHADWTATGSCSVDQLSGIITSTVDVAGWEESYTGIPGPSDPYQRKEITSKGAGTITTYGTPDVVQTYAGGLTSRLDSAIGKNYATCLSLPIIPEGLFGNTGSPLFLPNCTLSGFISWWNSSYFSGNPGFEALPAVTDLNSYSASAVSSSVAPVDFQVTISWTRTNTSLVWNFVFTGLHPVATGDQWRITFTGSIALVSPYTSADCLSHLYEQLGQWNMGDPDLAKLREDELLALSPMVVRDEVGPNSIYTPYAPSMNDYSVGLINDPNGNTPGSPGYVTTFAQRDWIDPNDYVWQADSGHYFTEANVPSTITDGSELATLIGGGNEVTGYPTHLRTGEIISHTQKGSDRHFWFGFKKMMRVLDTSGSSLCEGLYHYYDDYYGAFSESPLPEVTMRWRDISEAQIDTELCCSNGLERIDCGDTLANHPQSFLKQKNGVLIGGKYVEAPLTWPSANYGSPCGWRRYEVDQTTVCCIVSGDAASGYVVKPTGNATSPGATGGILVGSFIAIESDGFYKVATVTDNMDGTFTLDMDTSLAYKIDANGKIEELPTGFTMIDPAIAATDIFTDGELHVGKLRWVNFTQGVKTYAAPSAICGRAAITTSESGGTVTITTAALPYLRKDMNGDILVDLYDASMANKIQASLTRVSDTSFTFTHAAIPTHVWMTGRDYTWTDYTDTPQRTFVTLQWGFDLRSTYKDVGDQPAYYCGTSGCTSYLVAQQSYAANSCVPLLGFVPFYSQIPNPSSIPAPSATPPASLPIESSSNQMLFAMPDVFLFDDIYGALWLGAVETTMPDPFWQAPYKPDCALGEGESMTWAEDSGCGALDTVDGSGYSNYYPHAPLVEAAVSGGDLPGGITLFYDPTDEVAPPYCDAISVYPLRTGGITGTDSYTSVWRPWGFALRVCESPCTDPNRFGDFYLNFTACP